MLALTVFIFVVEHCRAVTLPTTLPTDKAGWLGADIAYSRLVSSNFRIWIFGDTFVGEIRDGKRTGSIVNNSVAFEKNGRFQYSWGESAQGFFRNQRGHEWYWPGDLFVYQKRLYVFLRRVRKTKSDDPFGFETIGNDLAVVENFELDPKLWSVKILPLGLDYLNIGVAAAVKGRDVFVYSETKDFGHALFLSRISFGGSHPQIKFFHRDTKAWASELPAEPSIEHGASEGSLTFVSSINRWRIILSPNGLSSKIVSYEAADLKAKWQGPKEIYDCDEMKNPNYYCYGAKEVDTGGKGALLTYSVNSYNFWDLARDPGIYVPRRVDFRWRKGRHEALAIRVAEKVDKKH